MTRSHLPPTIMATSSTLTSKSYPSTAFLESAGTVLFNLSTNQICLLRYKSTKQRYVLPKGRRNIGENRHDAAIRETAEETGFNCQLLPVSLESWQPPAQDEGGYIGAPLRHQRVCEPFFVTHRMLKDGTPKIVWWYVAAVDEDTEPGNAEAHFETQFFDMDTAAGMLHFEDDRGVVAKAVEIYKVSYVVTEES